MFARRRPLLAAEVIDDRLEDRQRRPIAEDGRIARQQQRIPPEVLDAETRRIQSLTNFYNALYDELLAVFRLRRAVGDL